MLSSPLCHVVYLGTIGYQEAWDLQVRLADSIRHGEQPNTLLLLEHPPVYTVGRLSKPDHASLTPEQLQSRGASVHETDRGGQVTFHGPGQLVAYPVVDLREWGGPVKYVRTLESVISATLADFGLNAHRVEGLTGVWVGDAKVAAIGVRISRGIAYHGLSINVNTDLSYYEGIVPCGIEDRPVTSMVKLLGEPVNLEMVGYSLAYRLGMGMGFRMVEVVPEAIASAGAPRSHP